MARFTFETVSNTIEIDIVKVIVKKEQTEPRIERVDGHDEQEANDPFLLVFDIIVL